MYTTCTNGFYMETNEVSKFDDMSFTSQAYFYVDGHAYDPYLGQA